MANWSGTYTPTSASIGAVTSATSNTLTNSGATWPTGANGLTNFTCRILTGPGAGEEKIISSNTATVLTLASNWSTTPTSASTYEIVLVFSNSDHITGSVTLSTGGITELQNSATILVDGAYSITLNSSTTTVRWQKTIGTMVTFCGNTRTVTGKAGFWSGIVLGTSLGSAPQVQFIKIQDAATAIDIRPSTGMGDGTTVKNIWIEACSSSASASTGTPAVDMTFQNIYVRNAPAALMNMPTGGTSNNAKYTRCWQENSAAGGFQPQSANGCALQLVDQCVVKGSQPNRDTNVPTGKTFRVQDSWISAGKTATGSIVMGANSAASAGTHQLMRSVIDGARTVYGGANSTATIGSSFNDMFSREGINFRAIEIAAGANYTASTSDNDYIAGTLLACVENIDTSASTSSTASPAQYQNLTASRTNAKAVKNRPLSINNISVGTPSESGVTITFDCTNGAVSGQGSSTVNSDSASGQAVLSLASTTGFEVGETVEIGYGTVRAETFVISSISAGVSITGTTNLAFSHTAVQADVVTKRLRQIGIPFIRYGIASGVYTMQTPIPDKLDWGLVFTNIKTSIEGMTFAWNYTGHSVTAANLKPSTTYYAIPCIYTPLDEIIEGAEQTFVTSASTAYTDPGIAQVKTGTSYTFNSSVLTGTYTGSDRWTDPGVANVRSGTAYKVNSTTNNTTGTLDLPQVATVLSGVTFDNTTKTGTLDPNTAGNGKLDIIMSAVL